MKNLIWFIIRPFYILGLFFVVPVFLLFCINYSKNIDVSLLVVFSSIIYFLIGYFILNRFPMSLKGKLLSRVERHKKQGFIASYEVISVLYNRYIGFDLKSKSVLYIDETGVERTVAFDKIHSWHLSVDKRPTLLNLSTYIQELPSIDIRISSNKANQWIRNLNSIFN